MGTRCSSSYEVSKAVLSPQSSLDVTSNYLSPLGLSFVVCKMKELAGIIHSLPMLYITSLGSCQMAIPQVNDAVMIPDSESRSDSGGTQVSAFVKKPHRRFSCAPRVDTTDLDGGSLLSNFSALTNG